MEFLSLAVGKLLDCTVAPLARQVGYVIFYHRNVNELMEKNRALQHLRGRVQHDVAAATRNGDEIENDVLAWLGEVTEIARQVHELNNEEHQANKRCSGRPFPNISFMHQLGRRSKKMNEEIAELMLRGNFGRVSSEVVPKSRHLSSPSTSKTEAVSRESIQNDIIEALKDPNVHTIGVHGMPGVGKTTLVKAVAQKIEHHKIFDVIIFAEVTQNLDVRSIQEEIAHKLGLNLREYISSARADRLHHALNLEQRAVLMILDDVWENFDMDDIGIASVEKNKHLKILMTSRSEWVLCSKMNVLKHFSLPVLPKKEAWKLFVDMAKFNESAVSKEFRKTATLVAEECGGLPIAIVTIAGALRGRGEFEWKDVLTQLQNLSSANITGMEKIISKIKVSYDKLESELLKSLFLLCGVMQPHFLVTDLLSIAIGLDLFDDTHNMEEARNRLRTCIRKLKDSCLLLDSYSSNRFNMHDIVKDAAINLASREQNLFIRRFAKLERWPVGDQVKNYGTVILDYCDLSAVSHWPDFPNVTFFHLLNTRPEWNITQGFLNGMLKLKVLNLTGAMLSSLPSSIIHSSNLSTLCLNVKGDIGIIGDLTSLKVLTLSSDISQLPSKLSQLKHLQLLDLRGCYNLVLIPPNILSRLKTLQELYLKTDINADPIKWYFDDPKYKASTSSSHHISAPDPYNRETRASLGELKDLTRLTTLELHVCNEEMLPKNTAFDELRSYKIIIGSSVPNLLAEYETSRMLKLDLSTSIHSWPNLERLLHNVEDLHLYRLKRAESVVPGINDKGMAQLKYLDLHFNDEMLSIVDSSWWNRSDDIFPNLEKLIVYCAGSLKNLCNGPLTRGSFSRLEVINIANCGQLKTLFSISTIRGRTQSSLMEERISNNENAESLLQFNKLQTLILKHLPQLISFWHEDKTVDMDTEVVTVDNIPCNTPISLFTEKVMLPNLEEMIIRHVHKLNQIWHLQQQLYPKSFDKLRKLEIKNCQKLVTIFPFHIGSSLHNLQILLIKNCESLEQVFDLQGLYSKEAHGGISGTSEVLGFLNLKEIYVKECGKVKYLFPEFVAKTLGKLQRLKLKNCSMIEQIILKKDNANPSSTEEVIVPNLKEKITVAADKLKTILFDGQQLAPNFFGRLKNIEIQKCPKLMYVFPCYVNTAESMETFTIVDCKSLEQIFDLEVNPRERHSGNSDQQGVTKEKQARGMFSFPNLLVMHVEGCERMRYLPASTTKGLSKLSKLFVGKCPMVEEIIIVEDNAHPFSKEVDLFPNLEEMVILDMDMLNTVVQLKQQIPSNSLGRLKKLEIRNCPKLVSIFQCIKMNTIQNVEAFTIADSKSLQGIMVEESSHTSLSKEVKQHSHVSICNLISLRIANCERLTTVLPFNVLKSLIGLKELEIQNCLSAEVVFDLGGMNIEKVKCTEHIRLQKLILESLPNLKHVWSKTGEEIVTFHKLEVVRACGCPSLTSLFPANIGKRLYTLEELTVNDCGLEEIVAREEGQTMSIKFQFTNLDSLVISNVPNLKSFYPGEYTANWPAVKKINVDVPSEVNVFGTRFLNQFQKHNSNMSTQNPIFMIDEINPKLEELAMNRLRLGFLSIFPQLSYLCIQFIDDDDANFPYQGLEGIPSLRKLTVKSSSFKDIFPSENPEEQMGNDLQLNELSLQFLPQLECICKKGFVAEKILSVLGSLHVVECPCLKNLVPSSVSFSHLTHLEVHKCVGLFSLMTSTTAKSLIKLRAMKITECPMVKEIVADDVDDVEDEIVFADLEILELHQLSSLGSFCLKNHTFKFPSLNKLVASECAQMKMFCFGDLTTPLLERVLITVHGDEGRWEGDLNTTIKQISQNWYNVEKFIKDADLPYVDAFA